jgi:hypothetical protein
MSIGSEDVTVSYARTARALLDETVTFVEGQVPGEGRCGMAVSPTKPAIDAPIAAASAMVAKSFVGFHRYYLWTSDGLVACLTARRVGRFAALTRASSIARRLSSPLPA